VGGVFGRNVEGHADLGPVRALPHGRGVGAVAERQSQRVDED
jgi:hypothetical protein